MKKIVLIALFALMGITMQGQAFGVKGGFNFSNLTGENSDDYNVYTSFHVGVLYEIELLKHVKIQPELLYSVQGAKRKNDEIKLNYFTVPAVLKIYLNDGFNIQAGPQFGMLLSESDNFEAFKSKTFDFGFTGGVEFFVTDGLFVQARYYYGTQEVSSTTNLNNRVVQASLGYIF
jgi:opacity protein-like surface antigen